jgi:hypothetical protein
MALTALPARSQTMTSSRFCGLNQVHRMSLSSHILINAIIIALSCGMLCAIIAFSKDRCWLGFAVLGILLGPIGLIVTGLAQPYTPERTVIAVPVQLIPARSLSRPADRRRDEGTGDAFVDFIFVV